MEGEVVRPEAAGAMLFCMKQREKRKKEKEKGTGLMNRTSRR